MEQRSHGHLDQRTQKLKEFHRKVKLTLNDSDRDHLYSSLKKYQAERKLDKLLHSLKTILDTPVKLDLLKEIRGFIPPHQVGKYDQEVPYYNMAHKWKSRSMVTLNSASHRGHTLSTRGRSQPNSAHTTPVSLRRHASGGPIFQPGEGPVVKMLTISLMPGERLGFCVRGGSEHGLGIFVSEVEDESAAERCGLLIGDQVIEVNSISFDNIAGSSAVKVLTGSERLKVMVRRVGKIPGFKSTREKIAWYDIHQRKLVHGDPTTNNAMELPGSLGLGAGHERKINLNKPTKNRPHLGFNIRGGSEFGLGVYVSKTDPGGLADENGLRVGEELLEVNGLNVRDKTHAETVAIIKSQKSLIITVRDVGRYPAFKEIYAEYKWVDVNTGRITKTRCYKKHALVTSGHIKSIAIKSPVEEVFRQPFSESHIERLSDGEESDGLDDVMMYLESETDPEAAFHYGLALQEEKELHGDFIHQTPLLSHKKSGLRNHHTNLTRSLENIPRQYEMDTVVPVSPMSRSTSEVDLSFSGGGYSPSSYHYQQHTGERNLGLNGHAHHRLYTPNNNNSTTRKTNQAKASLWEIDNQNTDLEESDGEDRLFYKRPKSAMESAMEFSSIHDIHLASHHSNNNISTSMMYPESDDESAVIPRRRNDVMMMQKVTSDGEESLSKATTSGGQSERSKGLSRSSLAVQALQNEARRNNPHLVSEGEKEEVSKRTDQHGNSPESRSRSSDKDTKGSRSSSKSRSLRERLFGSRSKDRDKQDKKKSTKNRKPLSNINFDHSDNGKGDRERKQEEIRQNAEGLLSPDETAAVLRHLILYADDSSLYGLTQRLFAILDSTKKMKLCTHIRSTIREGDQKAFDSAVNDQFDSLERQQVRLKEQRQQSQAVTASSSNRSVSSKPPLALVSKENKVKVLPKRVKRKAPPPPISPSSSVTTSHLSDMSSFTSLDCRNRLETSPESSQLSSSSPKSMETSLDRSQLSIKSDSIKTKTRRSDSSSVNLLVRSSSKVQDPPPPSQPTAVNQEDDSQSKVQAPPLPQLTLVNQKDDSQSKVQAPPPPPPPPPLNIVYTSPVGVNHRKRQSSSGSSGTESHSTGSGSTMVKVDIHRHGDGSKGVDEEGAGHVFLKGRTSDVNIKYGSDSNLLDAEGRDNFKQLANQKLEEFKQRSYHGSKDSLHSVSDQDIGSAKQSVMSELELQWKRRTSQHERSPMSSPGPTPPPSGHSTSSLKGDVRQSSCSERDSGLVEVNYVDSESIFPAPSFLISSTSTMANDRGTEASQSESVLQATEALAFLDNMDTDSQFELSSISHVVTPRSEISHLITPRSDTSGASAATSRFGSYDVNPDVSMSTSFLSNQSGSLKRTPPRFIAPPPPSESPPSEDEQENNIPGPSSVYRRRHSRKNSDTPSVTSSASGMASLRSYRQVTDDGKTVLYKTSSSSSSSHGDTEGTRKEGSCVPNGYSVVGSWKDKTQKDLTTVANGYHDMEGGIVNGKKDAHLTSQQNLSRGMSRDEQTTSWLFKDRNITVKPKDSSTLGPSGGEKVKQQQQSPPPPPPPPPMALDLSRLEGGQNKDTVMVYLDKSFKTMGLSISGGTDSKVQPEIKVKAVFPGGAAEAEGTMKPGMQIVAIDNTSLVNVTHMRAVVTIKKSFENKSRGLMALEILP